MWRFAGSGAALILLLAGCGGSAASSPAAPGSVSAAAKPASAAASAEAKPAGSAAAKPSPTASASAGAAAAAKPEKAAITVALPSDTAGTMPTRVGQDGGYFTKYGLTVNIDVVSASAAAQALTAGSVNMYQGGTTSINADLGGADLIYFAAPVDRSNLVLIGQKGITSFDQLRGKSVATTSPGAFGEIAMKKTAKEHGMEVPKDIKLLYHPNSSASLTTFISGGADALIAPPPFSTQALDKGYPTVVDFYKEGLKIVGPALSSSRAFYQQNPNTVKAFLMGYLDALKRSLDDPAFFKATESKYAKITDQALLDSDYQDGMRTWNKDLRVDPASIQVVLDALGTPEAQSADVKRFYDNAVVDQVMREYGVKVFPNDVKP
jgi:NitT/TauT family transport system substrate-binding protein